MNVFQILGETSVIPVVKLKNIENATLLAQAIRRGGIKVAEIAFRAPGVAHVIATMRKSCPDMLIGAGTVLTMEQMDEAISAGAQFIGSPGLNPKNVEHCRRAGIPILPGCVTPTEIEIAMDLGLNTVKFFPAEQFGGVKAIQALAASYPHIKFIPTGGISPQNLAGYLASPYALACSATFLASEKMIDACDWDGIAKTCEGSTNIVKKLRGKRQ